MIFSSQGGLIEYVEDNFDAQISSPNDFQSTYALAILMTQPQAQGIIYENRHMKRLKKSEMSKELLDLPIDQYEGPKQTLRCCIICSPRFLKILEFHVVFLTCAHDVEVLQKCCNNPKYTRI